VAEDAGRGEMLGDVVELALGVLAVFASGANAIAAVLL
jgi:hypothetical protein